MVCVVMNGCVLGRDVQKEALQLVSVAYMVLRRFAFAKIATVQIKRRRTLESTSSPISPRLMLRSIAEREAASHVAGAGPKLTAIQLP